jgi:hypothetical protein
MPNSASPAMLDWRISQMEKGQAKPAPGAHFCLGETNLDFYVVTQLDNICRTFGAHLVDGAPGISVYF